MPVMKTVMICLGLVFLLFGVAGRSHSQVAPSEASASHAVMRPDWDTLAQWKEDYDNAPAAAMDSEAGLMLKMAEQQAVGTSMSLLSYLDYVPRDRNQNLCGNCWVWAAMGVLEIADSVSYGSARLDRHSIQLLNSCMTQYNGSSFFACSGGNITMFSDWYRSWGYSIPWSNTNAYWQDGLGGCGSPTPGPCVACNNITVSPNFPITAIQPVTITTRGVNVTQDNAITNIKNVLQQNKAVEFDFCLATTADWTTFESWWNNQAESVLLPNVDNYCGKTVDSGMACHAILLVGYNDDDANAANHYWLFLNSWGVTAGRPSGLMRIPMVMDYGCTMISGTPPNTLTQTTRDFWTLNTGSGPNTLTVTRYGSGAVTSTPAGISCGAACSATFTSGTIVTLTATPLSGSTFTGWGNDCTGAGTTCVVTMDKGRVATATFSSSVTSSLTVAKMLTNNGNGTVTSTPAGISCGSVCKYGFNPGDTVTLNATPNASSSFTGWSGGGCSGTGTCVVTVGSAGTTVSAAFLSYSLSISKTGGGGGTVISTPAGVSCGATCSKGFPPGTLVTLSASPLAGSVFTGWSGGGCSGTGTCTITMGANQSVKAGFDLVCTYSATSPLPLEFKYNGGYKTIKLAAANDGGGACPAPVISIDPAYNWLSYDNLTFGSTRLNKNKGSVRIKAFARTDSYTGRDGLITIGAGTDVPVSAEVNQTGKPCTLGALKPASASFGSSAYADQAFNATLLPSDCPWGANADSSWITVTSAGPAAVTYSVEANDTGKNRIGRIIVALTDKPAVKRVFTIRQLNRP